MRLLFLGIVPCPEDVIFLSTTIGDFLRSSYLTKERLNGLLALSSMLGSPQLRIEIWTP